MKRILILISLLPVCIVTMLAQNAGDALTKILNTIESDGVKCTFSLHGQGDGAKVSLLMNGIMFYMSTPESSSWFDGKTLWTGNLFEDKVEEVYISEPSLKEMEDNFSNPYLVIKGHKGFNVSMPDDKTLLFEATDTNGRNGIKSIRVSLDQRGMPSSAQMRTVNSDDEGIDITIEKFETNIKTTIDDFTYPAGKWPEAEVIDLR